MLNHRMLITFGGIAALTFASALAAHADTLAQVTSSSAQKANDSLSWSQKGADGTVLGASFSASTANANSVTVNMGAANSIISVVCSATPCSWTGTGFTAGHSLLWSSDAGNGGSGPVTLNFSNSVSGAGALIQADLPGAFTGEIQVYNGNTLLATYTVASDSAGDPVYLGAVDQSGANISSVVFSLTACASLCTDFGLDTVNVNSSETASTLTSPTPGSVLAGPSVTFSWTTSAGASGYGFRLGTTAGGNDLWSSGHITTTSTIAKGLPTNGETVFARLYTLFGSATKFNDYTFTAATRAALTSPTGGSVLTGATETFNWSTAAGATGYALRLGSSVGANDIWSSGHITTTSATAKKLPTNGSTVYGRLYTIYGSTEVYTDYTFTAHTAP